MPCICMKREYSEFVSHPMMCFPPNGSCVLQAGARVFERGTLVHPTDSRAYAPLVCAVPAELHSINHPDWEIELSDLHLGAAVGEGEFGVVHNGLWNGTPVAIKVLMHAPHAYVTCQTEPSDFLSCDFCYFSGVVDTRM